MAYTNNYMQDSGDVLDGLLAGVTDGANGTEPIEYKEQSTKELQRWNSTLLKSNTQVQLCDDSDTEAGILDEIDNLIGEVTKKRGSTSGSDTSSPDTSVSTEVKEVEELLDEELLTPRPPILEEVVHDDEAASVTPVTVTDSTSIDPPALPDDPVDPVAESSADNVVAMVEDTPVKSEGAVDEATPVKSEGDAELEGCGEVIETDTTSEVSPVWTHFALDLGSVLPRPGAPVALHPETKTPNNGKETQPLTSLLGILASSPNTKGVVTFQVNLSQGDQADSNYKDSSLELNAKELREFVLVWMNLSSQEALSAFPSPRLCSSGELSPQKPAVLTRKASQGRMKSLRSRSSTGKSKSKKSAESSPRPYPMENGGASSSNDIDDEDILGMDEEGSEGDSDRDSSPRSKIRRKKSLTRVKSLKRNKAEKMSPRSKETTPRKERSSTSPAASSSSSDQASAYSSAAKGFSRLKKLSRRASVKLSQKKVEENAEEGVGIYRGPGSLPTLDPFTMGLIDEDQRPNLPTEPFGKALNMYMCEYRADFPDAKIPMFVGKAIASILKSGISEVGIFRTSGSASQLTLLKDTVNLGMDVDFTDVDPVVAANFLGHYIRELPSPLVPSELYGDFLTASQMTGSARDIRVAALVELMPPYPQNMLLSMIKLFYVIQQNNAVNKMTADNLGIAFGPSILYDPDMDQVQALNDAAHMSEVCALMISSYYELFEKVSSNRLSDCVLFHTKLVVHREPVTTMVASSDGKYIVTGDTGGTVHVAHPEKSITVETELDNVFDLAFVDDELVCVAGGAGLIVVNCRDGSIMKTLDSACVRSLAVCTSVNELLVGGENGRVRRFSLPLLEEIAEDKVEISVGGDVTQMVACGEEVWIGTSTGDLSVWDSKTRTLIKTVDINLEQEQPICCLRDSGDKLWLSLGDEEVLAVDPKTKAVTTFSAGSGAQVKSLLAFGGMVWVARRDSTITIHDDESFEKLTEIAGYHANYVTSIVAVDAGTHTSVWMCSKDRSVTQWRSFGKPFERGADIRAVRLISP
eukprot:TRINITY_DN10757_c0_g1_i1.p1 TRINITY_DN10757_c0_g1~~TRINITY_DN10757_c0_g1_i1.p1  ORF type:complete len:1036 (-),score=213.73 TRINITY_DN10757_c0_g1_i1:90-3197(-)